MIAIERDSRRVTGRIRRARDHGFVIRTTTVVVAQVWRDPLGRQARLARALRGIEVVPIDEPLARECGVLLGNAGTSDVVDATVALVATDGDAILTSDPADLQHLATTAGRRVRVVPA